MANTPGVNKYTFRYDLVVVGLFLLMVLLPWSSWFDGNVNLNSSYLPFASAGHPLGTDNIGRDLLVRVAGAIKQSVLPLWACVSIAATVGVCLSLLGFALAEIGRSSGWRFGWVPVFSKAFSKVFCRVIGNLTLTVIYLTAAVPVFILVFILTLWQQQTGIRALYFPLAVVVTARFIRLVQTLYWRDRALSFWTAATATGSSQVRVLWKYGIIGSWRSQLIDEVLFMFAIVVSVESAFSYLGIGVAEPMPSFGNMLASHFDDYLRGKFYILSVIAMSFLFTLSIPRFLRSVAQRLCGTASNTAEQ